MSWFHRKRTREVALVVCFLLPSLANFFLYRLLNEFRRDRGSDHRIAVAG